MHCTACGYDLAAHSDGERCPECGLDVDMTLWVEFDRADESSPERFGTIVIGGFWMFCAGAVVTIALIALWSGGSAEWHLILAAAVVPALLAGLLSGVLWKQYARMWASVFAWPMLGWGVLSMVLIATSGIGILIWPPIAIVTLTATIGGAVAGRRFVRVRVPSRCD